MTTPPITWCPAFGNANFPWLRTFPIKEVFGPRDTDGKFPCRLCEDRLYDTGPGFPVLTAHARHHKFEYREWRVAEKAQMELVA